MTRIAFFAPLLRTGGTQRHLQQVLRLLDPVRFSAEVFTLRLEGELVDELRGEGVPVTALGIERRLATPAAARAVVRTARTLRARGIQVVHGYQWRPALIGALAGRLARTPLVLASKRSLTGGDRQARRAWRVIGRTVDTIVVNAHALRAEAEAQGTRARWEMIPSGVDVERFRVHGAGAEAKAALGLDPRRPVVGTVGRLEERKGHEHFLEAARVMLARANGLRPQVLIVGDGPLRARLVERAAALGIAPHVRFAGELEDVPGALAAMDVFVLPSRAEGMSNALLEAMAAGRPVVATAVGGTREVLEPTPAGLAVGVLVGPDDVEGLARATTDLLIETARAAEIGAAAREAVAARFGARSMVARLERLWGERLAVRTGAGAERAVPCR
jgi:glycosyltransferase involved in cell wall biosynthesis